MATLTIQNSSFANNGTATLTIINGDGRIVGTLTLTDAKIVEDVRRDCPATIEFKIAPARIIQKDEVGDTK